MRKLLPWQLPDLSQPCEKIASILMEKRYPFIRVATQPTIIWIFTDIVDIKIFATFKKIPLLSPDHRNHIFIEGFWLITVPAQR